MSRSAHLETFYSLLNRLSEKVGGMRQLSRSHGRMNWAHRGVYFFFEPGETRHNSDALRVVRVGTHAVSSGSKTTLWKRLYAHKGTGSGGGNHRGSVFRLHVGQALIERDGYTEFPHWGEGSSAKKPIREAEQTHEKRVSEYIGNMPFLWLEVDDEPGKDSDRAYIERNTLMLIAGADGQSPVDPPSDSWLGLHSAYEKVRQSGVWNIKHVGSPENPEYYDPAFLEVFKKYIDSHTTE